MSQMTDHAVQWDTLLQDDMQESQSVALLDPLSDTTDTLSNGQQYTTIDNHVDIDISDDKHFVSNNVSSSSSSSSSSIQSSHTPAYNLLVKDARKETDQQQGTFVSYLVESRNASVRRRFQDFVWLHNVLYNEYPACFVPPLPDKHRLEYVKGDRFSSFFIEKRRISLERFIQRISRHPILGRAQLFTMFLESSEFNDASARALREGQDTMMDTIGDSLLNAFSRIRKADPRFIEMKEHTERMEENLDLLQKTLLRSNKRTEDLCKDYHEFVTTVKGLLDLDSGYKGLLEPVSDGLDQFTTSLEKMTVEDSKWQIEIHDYMAYYHSIKGVLKLRDQKQLDFEELSDYLQASIEERDKTRHSQRIDTSMTGYITGKINEVRGADADKIKREKVLKLDERVRELQEAIEQTHQVSTAFSDQVKKEDAFFNTNKSKELYDVLSTYVDAKVDHYQKGVDVWRQVVQALENDQVGLSAI